MDKKKMSNFEKPKIVFEKNVQFSVFCLVVLTTRPNFVTIFAAQLFLYFPSKTI